MVNQINAGLVTTGGQWLNVTDADPRVYGGRSDFRLASKIKKRGPGLSFFFLNFSHVNQNLTLHLLLFTLMFPKWFKIVLNISLSYSSFQPTDTHQIN